MDVNEGSAAGCADSDNFEENDCTQDMKGPEVCSAFNELVQSLIPTLNIAIIFTAYFCIRKRVDYI